MKFTTVFDGGGRTISNLYINRNADRIGLFGQLSGELRGLGLSNGSATSTSSTLSSYIGGLVGISSGKITLCFSGVHVLSGTGNFIRAGSLAGQINDGGRVDTCYSYGSVASHADSNRPYIGGLIGNLFAQRGENSISIENCYSTGRVTTNRPSGFQRNTSIGPLIGSVRDGSGVKNIRYCYATGRVSTTYSARGLVGTITASYFDSTTSGISSGTGAQSTSALQTPTSATGIYESWDEDIWDFGTNSEYPVLKVDGDIADDVTKQRN